MKKTPLLIPLLFTLLASSASGVIFVNEPDNLTKARQQAACGSHGGAFNYETPNANSKQLQCRDGWRPLKRTWMNISGPEVLKALNKIEQKK